MSASKQYRTQTSGNIREDGTVTAAGKGQACVPTANKNEQFRKLKNLRDNSVCFDCPNTRPAWASVNHGVFLCLDCSATHRAMGVHLTFVRSVDLDEWTQRQIDAMRIGGNANARAFFRKHGFTDLHGGKTEKKYKCKAAVAYRSELAKLVAAEAAKRGEGASAAQAEGGAEGSLLENLDDVMKRQKEEEARQKVEAARGGSSAGVMHAVQRKASDLEGAKKLQVTPPNSGQFKLKTGAAGAAGAAGTGSRLVLRKPSSGSNAGSRMLKKKSSSGVGATKLRVNKLSDGPSSGGGTDAKDEGFEDVEETQKRAAEAEKEAQQLKDDEAIAKKLQAELDMGGDTGELTANGASAPKTTLAVPASLVKNGEKAKQEILSPPAKKGSNLEDNMNRLKNMTGDFFSGV